MNRFDSTLLTRASRKVSNRTAMVVQPNKAIVGANVFAHEAGIHTDGVLKHAETYEIMKPESVGLLTNNLVLGKHSGKSAFKKRLADLGFTLTESQVESALNRIKLLADEKKEITDADIEAIELDETESHSAAEVELRWTFSSLHVTTGNLVKSTATVTVKDLSKNALVPRSRWAAGRWTPPSSD